MKSMKTEINKDIENICKIAVDKLNHGSQMEKQYAIGMLKVIESVRITIKESENDDKLLKKIKEIFE